MSNAVAERISNIVHTQLGRTNMTSAGIRLRIGGISHRIEVATAGGRFTSDLVVQVDLALDMWFTEALEGLTPEQRGFLQETVVNVIRERHEGYLPKPADPRRLPLLLPKLPPSTEGRIWRQARRG